MIKKVSVQRSLFLSGLFIFILAGFISHFSSASDFARGLIFGVAIGLMLLSMLRGRKTKNEA